MLPVTVLSLTDPLDRTRCRQGLGGLRGEVVVRVDGPRSEIGHHRVIEPLGEQIVAVVDPITAGRGDGSATQDA